MPQAEEIDVSKLTEEQVYIYEVFSRMVGEVLTCIEAAIPEGIQLTSLKRLLNKAMYDSRNKLLFPRGVGIQASSFPQRPKSTRV